MLMMLVACLALVTTPTWSRVCRGLLAAAAQDDEGEGGAINALDSASAAGDAPEVSEHILCLVLAI